MTVLTGCNFRELPTLTAVVFPLERRRDKKKLKIMQVIQYYLHYFK